MMRRLAVILLLMVSLAGCRDARVRNFWLTHDIDYSEVDSARSQFIDYAALASLADTCAARASIDRLYDKLKKDEVAYYLYTEWVEGIFYHPLSPYRSETIFSPSASVDHISQMHAVMYVEKTSTILYVLYPGTSSKI